jgi:hypothetical protein
VAGRPAPEPDEGRPDLGVERRDLEVLDPPATVDLLDDELGVKQEVDLGRPELEGQGQRADDADVLGNVVGADAQVLADRRERPGQRIARAGLRRVDQDRSGRRRPGVALGGAIRPDDQPEPVAARGLIEEAVQA